MFSLASIWKRPFGRRLAVAALSLVVAVLPTVALASNETYTYADTTKGAVKATGGAYALSTTFAKQGTAYVATNPTYVCNDGTNGTATGTAALVGSDPSYTLDNSKVVLPAGCTISQLDTAITVAAAGASANPAATTGSCDQGSITWLMCPLMANLASTISKLATLGLQPLLEVSPLKQGNSSPLFQTWSHLRDFADVAFIIIFMLIVFSTSIQNGFDQYTIRKMLPRLVLAVIMVQFSYFLVGFVIDIGNVLGSGVNDLLVSVVDPSDGNTSASNLFVNIGEITAGLAGATGAYVAFATGFWVAALPILLGIGLSVLVVFATLALRYIVLAGLIVLSPLAMVAWVLPNTEKYFSKWLSALIRLVMMYPIIMGILAIAGHINQLLPLNAADLTGTTGGILIAIIKPLIIIAALAAIPATFKWAGAAVGNSHKFLQNIAGRGQNALKSSGMAADGRMQRSMNRTQHLLNKQNRAMMLRDPDKAAQVMAQSSALRRNTTDRLATSKIGSRVARRTQGARMWTRGAAMGTLTNSNGLALQRSYNSQFKENVKALGDLEDSEATVPNLQTAVKAMYGNDQAERSENMDKLRNTAPALMSYTKTVQGRAAIVRKLAEFNSIDDDLTRRMMDDSRGMMEYNQFIGNKAAKPDPKGKPTITFSRVFDPDSPQNTKFMVSMAGPKIAALSAHGLNADLETANWAASIGKVTGKDATKSFDQYERDELSKSIAQTLFANVSYGEIARNFTYGDREFMDGAKRAAIVRTMKANADLATEGNAKLLRDVILKQVIAEEVRDAATGDILRAQNTDIYDTLIEQAVRSDGFTNGLMGDPDTIVAIAKGWGNDESGTAQKRSFLKGWLGIP